MQNAVMIYIAAVQRHAYKLHDDIVYNNNQVNLHHIHQFQDFGGMSW